MTAKPRTVTATKSYCVYFKGAACSDAFIDDFCLKYFQLRLCNGLQPYKVKLHAYALLANEGFLLVTPATSTGLGQLMKALSKDYNSYFSKRFERESSPIGNNFMVTPLDGDKLILDCQKYIERRVLDEGLRQHAGAYQWSSYTANSFGCRSNFVTPHLAFSDYLHQLSNPYKAYREFIAQPFVDNYLAYIDRQVKSGKALAKVRSPVAKPVRVRRKVVKQYSQSIWL
ncbi:MAG: hypothetical protein AB8B95_04665 [Pseudohongiellaceae bacterium]